MFELFDYFSEVNKIINIKFLLYNKTLLIKNEMSFYFTHFQISSKILGKWFIDTNCNSHKFFNIKDIIRYD